MQSKPSIPPAPAPPLLPLPTEQPLTSEVSYANYTPSPSEIEVYNRKRQIISHWRTELQGSNEELSYAQGKGVGSANWSFVGSSDSETIPSTITNQTRPSSESQLPVHSPSYQPLRSPPVPLLARSPQHPRSVSSPSLHKPVPTAPGDFLFPIPASSSSYSQREAYIASALDLPMDILRQTKDGSAKLQVVSGGLVNGKKAGVAVRGDGKGTSGDQVEMLRAGPSLRGRGRISDGLGGTGDQRVQARDGKTTRQSHIPTTVIPSTRPPDKKHQTVSTPARVSKTITQNGTIRNITHSKAPTPTPTSMPPSENNNGILPVQYLTPEYQPVQPIRSLRSQHSQRSQRQQVDDGGQAVRSQQSPQSVRRVNTGEQGVQNTSPQGSQRNGAEIRRKSSAGQAVRSSKSQQSHRSRKVSSRDIPLPSTHQKTIPAVPAMGSRASRKSNNLAPLPQPPLHPITPPPTPQYQVPHGYSEPDQPATAISPLSPVPSLVPPGRQQLPLPRPALARSASSFDALGRRLRDVSTTSLTARFEPNLYPLPASHTTGEMTSPEVNSLPLLPQDQVYHTYPAPVASLAGNTVFYADRSQVHIGATAERAQTQVPRQEPSRTPANRPVHHNLDLHTDPHHGHLTPAPTQIQHAESQPLLPHAPPAARTSNHLSPRPESTEQVHITANPDEDHLTFEVPSGSRGRLRVSLAWLTDGGSRNAERARRRRSTSPPPVPPKSPRPFLTRVRDSFTPQTRRETRRPRPPPRRETPSPSVSLPSPRSPLSSLPYPVSPLAQEQPYPQAPVPLGFRPTPYYPPLNTPTNPPYAHLQPMYNMSAPGSGILTPFAYPQPAWPAQVRPRPSVRFPPSPTRAFSIEAPSARSSPGDLTIPLSPAQAMLGGAYPQLVAMGMPAKNLVFRTTSTVLPRLRNGNGNAYGVERQRSVWQRLAGRGRDDRDFEYEYTRRGMTGGLRDLETSPVGRWRSNVPVGRAPTTVPDMRNGRTTRARSGIFGKLFKQSREREFGQGYYEAPSPRIDRMNGAPPQAPSLARFKPNASRRDQIPPPVPGKSTSPVRLPVNDQGRLAREREKEVMRRMKAERRDARDARRSRSAATRSGDDLPGTAVGNAGKRLGTGRSEGMVRDWVGRFGGGSVKVGEDREGKLWKRRVGGTGQDEQSTRTRGGLMGLLIGRT